VNGHDGADLGANGSNGANGANGSGGGLAHVAAPSTALLDGASAGARESANGLVQNEAERGRAKRAVERIRGQLRQVDAEAAAIEREIAQRFHPYWGSLLKEANETSSFGDQV